MLVEGTACHQVSALARLFLQLCHIFSFVTTTLFELLQHFAEQVTLLSLTPTLCLFARRAHSYAFCKRRGSWIWHDRGEAPPNPFPSPNLPPPPLSPPRGDGLPRQWLSIPLPVIQQGEPTVSACAKGTGLGSGVTERQEGLWGPEPLWGGCCGWAGAPHWNARWGAALLAPAPHHGKWVQ